MKDFLASHHPEVFKHITALDGCPLGQGLSLSIHTSQHDMIPLGFVALGEAPGGNWVAFDTPLDGTASRGWFIGSEPSSFVWVGATLEDFLTDRMHLFDDDDDEDAVDELARAFQSAGFEIPMDNPIEYRIKERAAGPRTLKQHLRTYPPNQLELTLHTTQNHPRIREWGWMAGKLLRRTDPNQAAALYTRAFNEPARTGGTVNPLTPRHWLDGCGGPTAPLLADPAIAGEDLSGWLQEAQKSLAAADHRAALRWTVDANYTFGTRAPFSQLMDALAAASPQSPLAAYWNALRQ